MALLKYLAVATVVGVIAIFLSSDADFLLYVLPPPPPKSFAGQVVWIVGASGGIGASLAKDFVKHGAQVIISARREQELNKLADESGQYGLLPFVIPLDIVQYEAHEPAFKLILEKFGKLDIIILNAGRSQRDLAVESSIDDTEQLMKLNFHSFVALTKVVLPNFLENKAGQIIVVSSLAGFIPTPVSSTYSATKYAQRGYYGALRTEVSTSNISISLVSPGPVKSDIFKNSIISAKHPQKESEASRIPTERCTELMLKGAYYRLEEQWIAKQPLLLIAYLGTYFPGIFRYLLSNVIGPLRVKAFLTGGDVYDAKEIFRSK